MSIQITITGNTVEELKASAAQINVLLGATAVASGTVTAPLSATEQSRLRADATVVPPKDDKAAKAAAKAAEKAAKEAAAAAAKAAEEEPSDDDVLEEDGDDEVEELTHDDVKNLLLEVRKAYPAKNTIISEVVKEHGKAGKISEVDVKNLPAVAKAARELLAKAKK